MSGTSLATIKKKAINTSEGVVWTKSNWRITTSKLLKSSRDEQSSIVLIRALARSKESHHVKLEELDDDNV